jgi:response regulator RpfG family c-di-GMP phosphodiesterase
MTAELTIEQAVEQAVAPQVPAPGAAPQWTVLCVDDEPNILSAIRRALRGSGYRVLTAESGQQALQLLSAETVHLIVSDMRMPAMDGAQLLEQVRQQWPAITRILLTGQSDAGSTMAAINRGEIFRYISKPWNEDELLMAAREGLERQALLNEKARLEHAVARHNDELTRLNASLEQQVLERTAQLSSANTKLSKNYLSSIKAFSNLVELRGGSTAGHSRRVAELARRIAVQMNLPAADVQAVFVAGLLHDMGHVGLSDALLACSVPRMTPEDKAQYEQHSALGEQALMALEDMQPVATIVRSHHERYDGMGFPDALSGDAIPIGARILSVADTYDDLQSGHLARAELAAADARMLVQRGRNTQFDPSVVDAFVELQRTREAPPSFVELSLDQLKPGMVLARDLRSGEGMVLLAADHVLNADLIQRLVAYAGRHGLSLLIAVRAGSIAAHA